MKSLILVALLIWLTSCHLKSSEGSGTETAPAPEAKPVDFTAARSKSNGQNKNNENCHCEGLVDWEEEVEIPRYDSPGGHIIDTLIHNKEGFLTFKLFDIKDNFFKVEIARAIHGSPKSGWIEKKDFLGTYARNYSDTLFLYSNPDRESEPDEVITTYYPNLYQIIDCHGKWLKVRMVMNGNEFQGWMEPAMQCPNPFTTCN